MKKRNLLTLVLALALVAALAVGGTLAYFTDNDAAQNEFTMGKVDIKLEESNGPDENGKEEWVKNGLNYTNVLPGNVETKKARVTVQEGSADCYVMVSVNIAPTEGSEFSAENIAKLYKAVKDAIDSSKWSVTPAEGGPLQCVYNGVAHATEELMLFETITIPAEFGNETADQGFTISLKAFAIQSDNLKVANATDVDWANTTFEDYPVK